MRADDLEEGAAAALVQSLRAMIAAFARYTGWRGLRAAALVAAAALLDGVGILLLVPILGVVVGSSADGGRVARLLSQLGVHTPTERLAAMLGAFVLLVGIRGLVFYARDTRLQALQAGFVEAERNHAMRRLAGAPWSRVSALSHSRVTSLLSNEMARLAAACQFLVQGSVLLVLLVSQTVVAFVLAPPVAAAVLAPMLLGALALTRQARVRDLGGQLVRANTAMMANAGAFLGGLKSAAAQAAQAGFLAEFEAGQAAIRAHMEAFTRRQARGRLVASAGGAIAGAAVIWVGFAWLALPVATLLTLVLVYGRMIGPAQQLYGFAQNLVFALPSFEAVQALATELADAQAPADAEAQPPPEGPIRLVDVTFVRAQGGGVRAATLSIEPGAFVGIAGPSGAGKTTLVDLIVGLLEPQSGTVEIGGAPLVGGVRAGWHRAIAYVAQEGFLFHDTVRRNLAWGNEGASDEAMLAALSQAGADRLLARLERGLDTVVGERGTLLSGGERQRLALARALLRKPRLLVLDEAFNAIDPAGEAELLERVAKLDPRPTILLISHREESLRWCDRLVRVEAGRVHA